MKPERQFIAARPLAQHCPALLRPAAKAIDLSPQMATSAERLSRAMRGALSPLLGGAVPEVAVHVQMDVPLAAFVAGDALVAWSVYAGAGPQDWMLSAIGGDTALRLVDRAFGGPGDAPAVIPRELPLSAELMVQRLEAVLAAQIAAALPAAPAIRPLQRDTTLAQINPFADETMLIVLTLTVSEGARAAWSMRFAIPVNLLPAMVGVVERPPVRSAEPDPFALPYADMPLPVDALLVDVALPLSAISAFEVGQVLNLPIARSVPLRAGTRTIGHGSIGAVDDRVAIQLTQLS